MNGNPYFYIVIVQVHARIGYPPLFLFLFGVTISRNIYFFVQEMIPTFVLLTLVRMVLGANASPIHADECPAGTYIYKCRPLCHPCLPGSFSDEENTMTCTPCPLNSFNAIYNQTKCLPCPLLMYTEHFGQTQCQDCPEFTKDTSLSFYPAYCLVANV